MDLLNKNFIINTNGNSNSIQSNSKINETNDNKGVANTKQYLEKSSEINDKIN